MKAKVIEELSEVIQSSNINFLLGAGVSTPFLPLLGNIEQKLNEATTNAAREIQYKEYLTRVMLPNKQIVKNALSHNEDYEKTKQAFLMFFEAMLEILLQRKSTILSKQVNVFTTNIDILLETVLEELRIEYNDGFAGRFIPTFGLANFKKTIQQRSLHYDHISEIPVFNIIKIHGSLTWKHGKTADKIIFSKKLEHLNEELPTFSGSKFLKSYKSILVVNPEESKHLESVLNLYYSELLRLYSSELEKENATLFIIGFSMEDKHIREITLRSAKSNPTLRVFICCSKKSKPAMEYKMEIPQHPNIQIFFPDGDEKFTLSYLTQHLLSKIGNKSPSE